MKKAMGQGKERRPAFLLRVWAGMCYFVLGYCLNWVLWWRNRGRIIGTWPNDPFVLVANHGSFLDWMLLDVVCGRGQFGRKITFMAKEKLTQNPFLLGLVEHCRAIVVRDASRSRCLVQAVNVLKSSRGRAAPIIGIFPEGTRSRTGARLAASDGAAWLARKCGVPIVPVALCGFWEVWPPHRRLPTFRRLGLSIHILEPLSPADFADNKQLIETAMDRIYAVVESKKRSENCCLQTAACENSGGETLPE